MLETTEYTQQGWWSVVICVPLLLLVAWNLSRWKKRVSDYRCHPVCKRLALFGRPEQVAEEIERAVLAVPEERIGKVHVRSPWLFLSKPFSLTVLHIPDVVWIYQKVTKHYTNGIPSGKSFAAMIYDRYGWWAEVDGNEENSQMLLSRIAQSCPWVVAGFSKELEALWKNRKAEFIAAVDERRSQAGRNARAASV